MKTLKLTAIALVALSLTAVSSFAGAGSSTSQITDELNTQKATCSTKQFGKKFYDRESDTFTRHCSE